MTYDCAVLKELLFLLGLEPEPPTCIVRERERNTLPIDFLSSDRPLIELKESSNDHLVTICFMLSNSHSQLDSTN